MDKSKLFSKVAMPTTIVELPGIGTVTVRGLTRAEVLDIQRQRNGRKADWIERQMVRIGLTDPELTDDEVEQMYAALPNGHLDRITKAIAGLSGMDKEADREAMRAFREEVGLGTGLPAGGKAGNDGGEAAG